MKEEACYDVMPNEIGLEYIHNNKIDLNNVNDFLVKKIGANTGVDIIIYGYAGEYSVPYRYSSVSSDQSVQRVSNYSYNSDDIILNKNNYTLILVIIIIFGILISIQLSIIVYLSISATLLILLRH